MSREGSLIQDLHEIQDRCGYLPKAELAALVARRPGLTLHRVNEVATFFPHFRTRPPAGPTVRVCRDMACHLAGSPALRGMLEGLAKEAGPVRIDVQSVSCLGQCDGAPAALVGERVLLGLSPDDA